MREESLRVRKIKICIDWSDAGPELTVGMPAGVLDLACSSNAESGTSQESESENHSLTRVNKEANQGKLEILGRWPRLSAVTPGV